MPEREIKITSEERALLLFVTDKLIKQFKKDLENEDEIYKGHMFSAKPKYTKEWLGHLESIKKKIDF